MDRALVCLSTTFPSQHCFGLVLNSRAPNQAVGTVRKTAPNQEPLPNSSQGLDWMATPVDESCHILCFQALGQDNLAENMTTTK